MSFDTGIIRLRIRQALLDGDNHYCGDLLDIASCIQEIERLQRRPQRVVAVRSGDNVLYADEVCLAGRCCRPIGHTGQHDQFDGPPAPDSLKCHPPDEPVT